MIYIFLLIFFSINILPNYAQESNPVKNRVIIQDAVGDIQTRFLNSHIWTPVTAGITIPQNSFIRLNSPNSTISIAYPDGSVVRLIGVGSFFFENISELVNNAYQSKILVLFGRWTYQSHPDYQSRFIVNTDITTSVVENGIGAGFFYNGTNEFALKKGRGLISYRQQNAKAIVLDEQQYVQFNILEGFFFPKLATEELFKQYLIFSEEKTTINQKETKDLGYLSLLSYTNNIVQSNLTNKTQGSLVSKEIDIQQLSPLENLNFKKRSDFSQVAIAKIQKAPIAIPLITPVNTLVIPQSLLTDIDLQDFEITTKEPVVIVEEEKIVTPPRKARPVRVRKTPKAKVQKKPTPVKAKPKVVAPKNKLDDLLDSLDQSFAEEVELEVPPTPAPVPVVEKSGIIIEEIAPPVIEPIELIELEKDPVPQKPLNIKKKPVRKRVPRKRIPREETEADIIERLEEEAEARYKASEEYWNRNLNSDKYKYNQFELETTDDLMNSFSSVLLNM